MTQDEIIDKLLFQAGAHFGGDGINYEEFDFRKFAKLVAAKEREACAQTCENLPIPNQFSESEGSVWDVAALDCAEAIRAKGEKA
jgi:hypothetical protein